MKIFAYTDGAARNNPGKSASGYCLLDSKHRVLAEGAFYNGVCTNNVAEYKAVIAALGKVLKAFGKENDIVLISDSRLIVNQLAGSYKVKDKVLKRLNSEAKRLLAEFERHTLLNVSRENAQISKVDKELNLLLDEMEDKGE